MKSQFSIPKPCHENWGAMTPDEQGRFCSLCSKTVVDFTEMNNDEIIIYLRANRNTKICGRFSNEQLQEKNSVSIPKKVLYSQTKFINVFLLALLVTMGSILFSCKEDSHLTGEIVETSEDTITLPPPPLPDRKNEHVVMGMVKYPQDSITPTRAEQQKATNNRIHKSTNN
ncbi:hypothetical protein [Flavobacterium sp. NRK1]|uniref:hypothetical protein n=1 Tax=Flavobacterium sp. NRK1 TaxID=2954929 RepID=UPI002093A0BA|nr:hypothetical protein [Flavobacterium sp. NRK1]MCO6147247.1 hypothetical protein [Flavobacterium sp. NRK1]